MQFRLRKSFRRVNGVDRTAYKYLPPGGERHTTGRYTGNISRNGRKAESAKTAKKREHPRPLLAKKEGVGRVLSHFT
jgi:hypothetical protein